MTWGVLFAAVTLGMLAAHGPLAAALGLGFLASVLIIGARLGLVWCAVWSVAVIGAVALVT